MGQWPGGLRKGSEHGQLGRDFQLSEPQEMARLGLGVAEDTLVKGVGKGPSRSAQTLRQNPARLC